MNKLSGLKISLFLAIFMIFGEGVCNFSHARTVTLLAPARPHPENSIDKENIDQQTETLETDILVSLMNPHEYSNSDMDIPQIFAMFLPRYDPANNAFSFERKDILGDLEEIRYLDKKSWGANVSLDNPGTHYFILESKPWWDDKENIFRQHIAKAMTMAGPTDKGWDIPLGISLEIVPLTRPFGLYSPCLFNAMVLADGKPMGNITVHIGHINEKGMEAVSKWHENMVAKTNANGEFSAILNKPGWWYCEASFPGEPLKGSDGKMKKLERASVFWLYVDAAPAAKRKR